VPERHTRNSEPERRCGCRQHERLDEQLGNDAAATGAERSAHGDLASARRRASIDQDGDVHRDHHEQQADAELQ
jgi:hypothetical protein